jgi:fructose-bisphosphate aldolase class I
LFAGVENTEENRRLYREILFTTPGGFAHRRVRLSPCAHTFGGLLPSPDHPAGLNEYISSAIVFEETLFHKATDGTPFVEVLKKQNILTGIKVDKGTVIIAGTDGETNTQGIDDLAKRCQKYYAAGARFAKWRAVITIKDSGCPSDLAIRENCDGLARYAAICQMNGLVPIVEPEILMDGGHSLELAAAVTQKVLAYQYKALADHHVLLEGTLLKPNMVRVGEATGLPNVMADIARATVRVLQHTMPAAVPGVTFLSGGMSEEDATLALDAINKFEGKKPWTLTFSYGRALQQSVLKAWGGKTENIPEAQRQLIIRAQANSQASLGKYAGGAGGAAAADSLHVKNYVY